MPRIKASRPRRGSRRGSGAARHMSAHFDINANDYIEAGHTDENSCSVGS